MEKMIELKNNENEENIDIEDVIYCGQLDFEVNGNRRQIKVKDTSIRITNENNKNAIVMADPDNKNEVGGQSNE